MPKGIGYGKKAVAKYGTKKVEEMRKPGSKGAPTKKDFQDAAKTVKKKK